MQQELDRAALITVAVLAHAMEVRGLDRAGAVALIAEEGGAAEEQVEALLDRAGLLLNREARGSGRVELSLDASLERLIKKESK